MLLELKNIEAAYGNIKALKGINLAVPEGKIVIPSVAEGSLLHCGNQCVCAEVLFGCLAVSGD